jgi:histone deacetylase 6
MDTQDYAAVFHKLLLPMALEYGPELIFVAAGFDATRGDKMGIMRVSTAGYGYFTQLLKLINKKIIMSLEGGYNSKLTAMCVEKCVSVLLGQQVSATTPWIPSPQCLETIKYEFKLTCFFFVLTSNRNVALTHIKTGWKCFGDYTGISDNPNT